MFPEVSRPLNFLIAYPYFKQSTVDMLAGMPRNNYRLIVDSGAYSAFNSNMVISLDKYCSFLDSISHLRPFHAVQLDVFGDPEASYKNLLIMKDRGYDVMPVFTRGESLERLEEYYTYTDYIMFGGIVIGGKNKEYVKWFLNRNKGRKCHWLGFVNMPFIKAYKPESVDSNSWRSTSMFGSLAIYDGGGRLFTNLKEEFIQKPSTRMVNGFKRIGLTSDQYKHLGKKISWNASWEFEGNDWSIPQPGIAQFISLLAHLKRGLEVEKKLGTKIYMVGNYTSSNKLIFRAQRYLHEHGLWS